MASIFKRKRRRPIPDGAVVVTANKGKDRDGNDIIKHVAKWKDEDGAGDSRHRSQMTAP